MKSKVKYYKDILPSKNLWKVDHNKTYSYEQGKWMEVFASPHYMKTHNKEITYNEFIIELM